MKIMMPTDHSRRIKKIKSNSIKLTIDDALDRLEYGPFHTRLLMVACMAQLASCMVTMVGFFVPQAIQPDFELTDLQTASATAILFFGTFVGLFFVHIFKDCWGVRPIYLVCTLGTSLSGVLAAFASSYTFLMLMRFAVGFGLGGTSVPWYYIAEFMPVRVRAQSLLKTGLAWSLGSVLVPIFGLVFMENIGSWSLMGFACSFPSIFAFFAGLFYLPESPRYLMSKGRNQEALEILRDAAVVNHQDPWSICPQSAQLVRGGKTKSKWKAITRLFRSEWRRTTMSLLPAFLVVDFLYYSYVQLIHMAVSDTDGDEDYFAWFNISMTALSEFLGIVVAIYCIDKVGRVATQAVSYMLAALFITAVCIGRHFEENAPADQELNYLFYLSFLARMFIMTATSVTWVHAVEIFPKKIRSTFHLAAHALASLGAAASAYHMVSPSMTYLLVGIVVGVVTLLLSFLAWAFPETRSLVLGNGSDGSSNGAFGDTKSGLTSSTRSDEKCALTSSPMTSDESIAEVVPV